MVFHLDEFVLFVLWCAALPVGAFAFVHALIQRADAYLAADRMTKIAWSLITGGGLVGFLLFNPGEATFVLWMAALVAELVYIVDVRPKLNEVQRGKGNRW